MYQRKLERFLGLRADLEVRVQVNAQPFHAGRLMLSWTPFLNALGNDKVYYYTNPTQNFLTSVSGNPRVEIDLSTTTEATMHIPFVSPFLYYNLITGAGDIGTFQLIVYSPLVDLVSGGSIDYTIWVRMTNVRTEFPTGMPIVSVAQIGDEGDQQVKQGIVTRQSAAYSTILEPFVDVPVVGNVVKGIKSGVDALHNVASFYGWSKPLNPSETSSFKINPTRFMCNTDGSDMAVNLGLTAQNELEQCPELYRTDVDEMSITYIAKTPNYIDRWNWSKGQAPGTILWRQIVTPLAFWQTSGGTTLNLPHLGFVASNFVLWRGGINLRFKFVKTKFHSGRIRIVYVPGCLTTPPPANFDIDANYSTVVDLRSDTDVDFNIPYVAVVPWLRNSATFWDGTFGEIHATGSIFIYVLNELVNTSTVSDSIDVITEVYGADDIEFALPHYPKIGVQPAPELLPPVLARIRSVAQVGTDEGDKPLEVVRMTKSSSFAEVDNQPNSTSFTNSSLCIGEKITSLRQLIKRFTVLRSPTGPNDYWSILAGATGERLELQPNYFQSGGISVSDWITWFSSIFAFYRGSVRFKIIPTGLLEEYPSLNVILDPAALYVNQAVVAVEPDVTVGGRGAEVLLPILEGAWELQCPFYSSYPVGLTTANATSSDVLGAHNGFNVTYARFPDSAGSVTRYNVMVYRAAGDDYTFGFLMGPPVVRHP